MRKIAVLNQKGGVGKTTTVANTAAALAAAGHRVVVADFDPQAHLTIHLGVDADVDGHGAYEVLTKSEPIEDALINVRENLHLLAANIDLVGAESELVSVVGRETIFSEAIATIEDKFDYLIVDCPPSLGLLSLNALAAATEVFIPVQPHFLALQGFGKLLQTVTLVNNRINPNLRITAILLCMFDTRVTLSAEVKADIDNFLNNARQQQTPWSNAVILPVHVRRNIKLAEAPSHGKTIFEYEPNCNGAEDYQAIADFIHNKMNSAGVVNLEDALIVDEKEELEEDEFAEEADTEQTQEPVEGEVDNEEDYTENNNEEIVDDQPEITEKSTEGPIVNEAPTTEETIEETIPSQPADNDIVDPAPLNETHENAPQTHQQPPIRIEQIPDSTTGDTQQHTQSNYDFENLNYKPRTE